MLSNFSNLHYILLLYAQFLVSVSSKEVCRENNYVNGSWVIDKQITKKSFYCCQNDDVGTVAYCGDKVVGNENKFYPHEDLVIAPDKACVCDVLEGTRNTVSTREQYKWVPELCQLESFTGQQFCNVLGKRRLLLIGDSLMHQLASALMNVLKTLDAPCLGQISYGKSSHLKYHASNPTTRSQNMRMFFEKNIGADICLVNTGAHLGDGGDMYDMYFIWENIQPWVNEYKAAYNTTFAWVTQSYGHLHCENFNAPLEEYTPIKPEEYVFDVYNWR
eukprot:gene38574-50663_t